MSDLPIMAPAVPEIFLAVAGMVLLLIGAFSRADAAEGTVTRLTVLAMAVGLGLVLFIGGGTATAFGGMFITDGFAIFMKVGADPVRHRRHDGDDLGEQPDVALSRA
jgi:NADH-quinone oxidoreductase subunit N